MGAITGVGAMGGGGLASSTSPSSGDDVRSRFDCLLPSGDLEAFLLRGVGTIGYDAVVESSGFVVDVDVQNRGRHTKFTNQTQPLRKRLWSCLI